MPDKKKRIFIAIDLPDTVKAALGKIRGDTGHIKWIPKRNMHLTLRFIGGMDADQVEDLQQKLTAIQLQSFTLSLQHLGHFNKHILWINTDMPKALVSLKKAVDEQVGTLGFKPDTRPFMPHITLARIEKISQRALEEFIAKQTIAPLIIPVDHFTIVESNTDGGSPVYMPVRRFKLD